MPTLLPPTRILSYAQLVLEADPDWQKDAMRPYLYEFSNRRRFYATVPMYGKPYDPGLWNDGGVLALTDGSGWPTSGDGLRPGAVWNNGLTIAIVPGVVPQPGAPAVFFPGTSPLLTAGDLLLMGGGNLPLTDPEIEGQLYNNGGEIAVSLGVVSGIFTIDLSVLDGPDVLA